MWWVSFVKGLTLEYSAGHTFMRLRGVTGDRVDWALKSDAFLKMYMVDWAMVTILAPAISEGINVLAFDGMRLSS